MRERQAKRKIDRYIYRERERERDRKRESQWER